MIISRVARRALLAGALTLGWVASDKAHAQPSASTTFDLDDLLAAVEAVNPTLRAARLEAAALAQVGDQVSVLPDPTVSVTAFPYPIVTARGAQRSQWRVEQPIPWPGTLALRARAADLSAEVAGHEAEALALDLAFEVKRAYYDLHHADHVEAVLRTYQERLGAFAEAAMIRYEVGRGPQGAILQIQLEERKIDVRLHGLIAHRTEALQTLARLTDRPDLVAAPVQVVRPEVPVDLEGMVADAFRQRPELQALAVARERAETEAKLARKAFYPDLGVGLTYTDIADREVPATADGRDAFGVMLSARIPIQRGRLGARLEEARLRTAQVEARQDAFETDLRTQIATLAEQARQAERTVDLFDDRLTPQAVATVESTLAAYTTGEADYLAFLDAERTRFEVELAAIDAFHQYLLAVAALERALGGALLPASDVPHSHPSDARTR